MFNAQTIAAHFTRLTQAAPELFVRACGRVNVIGEHTDYNNGYVLPGAIDKYLHFASRPNGLKRLRLWALDIDRYAEVDLTRLERSGELWADYLIGIAREFAALGDELPGLDVVFGGNLPVGAGVSSSAALECGMAVTWNHLLGTGLDEVALARLAQRSSNTFLGIPSGILDQSASLLGRQESVLLFDCRSLEYEYAPMRPGEYEWVLLNSRVTHELGNSAYGQRVAECKAGVELLRRYYPEVSSLRDLTPARVREHQQELGEVLFRRCLYVTEENERTLQAVDHLRNNRWTELGRLLSLTHEGLRDYYEVSCREIDFLQEIALETPGVLGARLMGGGFGGCTLNLVHRDEAQPLIDRALPAYEQAFGQVGEAYRVAFVDGTRVVGLPEV